MSFKLVNFNAPKGNVGDDYSHWLFSLALEDELRTDGEILLFGVGSILSIEFEAHARDSSIRACAVFGSGARSANSLPDLKKGDWHVYCVRGPLTATAAGLPCEAAVADPAILAPRLLPTAVNSQGPVGIVPYFSASEAAWGKVADKLGWRLISPRSSVPSFIKALTECSRTWCESMHGAIFSDAYGIPWRPISATSIAGEGQTHAFKWTDWSASMGVGFDPLTGLPFPDRNDDGMQLKNKVKEYVKVQIMSDRLANADRQDRYQLSKRSLLTDRQDQLFEVMERMCMNTIGVSSKLKSVI